MLSKTLTGLVLLHGVANTIVSFFILETEWVNPRFPKKLSLDVLRFHKLRSDLRGRLMQKMNCKWDKEGKNKNNKENNENK